MIEHFSAAESFAVYVFATVRAPRGRLSCLSVVLIVSGLHGVFVRARRALNSAKLRLPARQNIVQLYPEGGGLVGSGRIAALQHRPATLEDPLRDSAAVYLTRPSVGTTGQGLGGEHGQRRGIADGAHRHRG